MAPSSFLKAFTLLSTAASFVSASYSGSSSNSTSICATSSKCVPFTIDVTRGDTNAGGFSRDAILVNGTFPGPPLKLKVGDCVDFTVINNMDEVTGVHFHGIRQYGTPWADGTPGVSQYSIPSGESYMYQWTADESGSYFYHAHYKGQMMDGLIGAIVIQSADDAEKPFSQISGASSTDVAQMEAAEADIEVVFASDWSQFTFAEFFAIEQAANVDDACTDSIILNGKGSVYCPSIDFLTANAAIQVPQVLNGTNLTAKGCIPASNPSIQGPQYNRTLANLPAAAYDLCTATTGSNYTYTVDASKGWAAMSFINPGGFALLRVSIDSHKLYIYEYNGNYITPQYVDDFVLSNGERISFLIELNQTPGNYQIRVANAGINQVVSGFGVVSYSGVGTTALSGTSVMNYGGQNTTAVTSFVAALAAPFPPVYPASYADQTFILDIMKTPNQPASWAWTLSGADSYNMSRDDEAPPLLDQNPYSIPSSDLILKTKQNTWVDLIIKVAGPVAEPHPMHKHANKFFMIGAGVGDFNFTDSASAAAAGVPLNLATAPYVDGFTSIPAEGNSTWMIFRYEVNTPGAWFFHCHVQTHFSGGMAVAILDAIDNFPVVPSDVGKVCPGSGTSGWTGSNSSTGSGSSWGSGSGSFTSSNSTGSGSTIATYTGAASAVSMSSWTGLLGLVAAVFVAYT